MGVGAIIVGLVLWEVFHDLFDPAGRAALTRLVGRTLFGALRGNRRRLSTAGPLTLVAVILIWVVALVVGFALIYLPFFPEGFQSSGGVSPFGSSTFMTVLYISAEALTTLGYGDFPPRTSGLRFVGTAEALVGFALLTASVSGIVLIYPALTRMRSLALGVSHIVKAEAQTGIRLASTGSDVILASLASAVTHARIDLVHFPIIYWFAPSSGNASIAKWTAALTRFAEEAATQERPPHMRVAAAALSASLDDLASLLAEEFLDMPSERPRDEIFEAFANYQDVDRQRFAHGTIGTQTG